MTFDKEEWQKNATANREASEREKVLEQAWVRFAAAHIASYGNPSAAGEASDALLEEFKKRSFK